MGTSWLAVRALIPLFLTIPVTSATAERNFSKLKLSKSYVRNAIGQERVSGLAILNIAAEMSDDMDVGYPKFNWWVLESKVKKVY